MLKYIYVFHSASAAWISYSVFPAAFALSMRVFVSSSAGKSSSPWATSTPNFAAISLSYLRFLILPIFAIEPCKSARAPKFGISPFSFSIYATRWSVAANPSSIYFWAAAIFALTSSTVSSWPSSSGACTGIAGSLANSSYSLAIFSSTAASPATNISYSSRASSLASATVWICSPFASTVGFSLLSFATFSLFALASFNFFNLFSAYDILLQSLSSGSNESAAAARAAACWASYDNTIVLPRFLSAAVLASYSLRNLDWRSALTAASASAIAASSAWVCYSD